MGEKGREGRGKSEVKTKWEGRLKEEISFEVYERRMVFSEMYIRAF